MRPILMSLKSSQTSPLHHLRQSIKTLAAKSQLTELCGRLDKLRNQISVHLLVLIREQQKNLARDLRRFASSNEEHQQMMNLKLDTVTAHLFSISKQTPRQGIPAQDQPSEVLEPVRWQLASYVNKVEDLIEQKRKMTLNNLYFSQIKEREYTIAKAHENTFQWVFHERSRSNLMTWLRHNDSIYWITGKAGSGKSTFMRFLTGHPSSNNLLKQWAGGKLLVTAKHYFWISGTAIQKSQEGLFRSLLLQILTQQPELISVVCADRWQALYADSYNPWNLTQLIEAFSRLGSLASDYRLCLFVDGLDEYDGDHAHLVSVIQRIGASDNIKICASSRPWLDFLDAFAQSEWTLHLQDLTHDDIRTFVQDSLNQDMRFNKLQRRHKAAAEGLGMELTERAHGVFLWVFLVVRSLLRGLRNEDEISDLQRRLRELPSDLREYFDRMFASIEDIYKERTARLFITMAHAGTTFPVLSFYFMDLGDETNTGEPLRLLQNWPDVNLDEAEVLVTKKRQLIAQCKDLIFITPEPGAGVLFSERVGFLHRTVLGFLQTADMSARLLQLAGIDFSPDKVLLGTNLGQLRSLIHLHRRSYIQPHLRQWLLGSLFYAHALEILTDVPETDALDSLEDAIAQAFVRWDFSHAMEFFFLRPDIISFLDLVCQCDLASYVCHKMPHLDVVTLDLVAPGWRKSFNILQDSNFEVREGVHGQSIGRRLEDRVKAQSSRQQAPTVETTLPRDQSPEIQAVGTKAPAKPDERKSSKSGRKFRGWFRKKS
ncbi:hypothetical protein ACHAQH_003255 [Verticillium albo-atrum]